jgi:hypothetical protein
VSIPEVRRRRRTLPRAPAPNATEKVRFRGRSKHEGSSSFLRKSTKELFLSAVRTDPAYRVNQQSKSFLVLFFKKRTDFLALAFLWK